MAGSEGAGASGNLDRKRADEAQIVSQMIAIYCRGNHADRPRGECAPVVRIGRRDVALCSECAELQAYACARILRCPRMDSKTFCSVCPVHCYKPDMRERIRTVMRWSGPRMLRYRPVKAMQHAIVTIKAKRGRTEEA